MDKTRAWIASQCRFAMTPSPIGPSGSAGLPGASWLALRQPTNQPHAATMVAPPGSKWCKKCREWRAVEDGKCADCESDFPRPEMSSGPPENY